MIKRTKCVVCKRWQTYLIVCFNCRIDADDNPNGHLNSQRRESHRRSVKEAISQKVSRETKELFV